MSIIQPVQHPPFTPAQEDRIRAIVRDELRTALKRPIRIELATLGPVQINAETFVESVLPEIERRLGTGSP